MPKFLVIYISDGTLITIHDFDNQEKAEECYKTCIGVYETKQDPIDYDKAVKDREFKIENEWFFLYRS